MANDELAPAVLRTLEYLERAPLTEGIAHLEHSLSGADRAMVAAAVEEAGIDEVLLRAALLVRRDLGRLNDVIHAVAIARALPAILEEGERIEGAPSLAAGNDPKRPFDVMTNMRVAEFKLSVWKGADPARKRGLFSDLAHLALHDPSDVRKRQLFVIGQKPIDFLRKSNSQILVGTRPGFAKDPR